MHISKKTVGGVVCGIVIAGSALMSAASPSLAGASAMQGAPYDAQRGVFSWAPLLRKVNPSVVRIELERGGGNGSGVLIDEVNGYIVTNRHVIRGVRRLTAILSNGKARRARVIAADRRTDLAILKIAPVKGVRRISFSLNNKPQEGDIVLAIGFPFGLQRSVIMGIVSNTGKPVGARFSEERNSIQIDALANPGNSGGPAINTKGQLIGIVGSIYGKTSQGISFVTPSYVVRKTVLSMLRRKHLSLSYSFNDAMKVAAAEPKTTVRQRTTRQRTTEVPRMARTAAIEQRPSSLQPQPSSLTAQDRLIPSGMSPVDQGASGALFEAPKAEFASDERPNRGQLGITIENITEQYAQANRLPIRSGVVITDVIRGSLAYHARLQNGDAISEIDGVPIGDVDDAVRVISAQKAKGRIKITYIRGSKPNSIIVDFSG